MNIPSDPFMLLSFINTYLRDSYSSLKSLCVDFGLNEEDIKAKLKCIDYTYDEAQNKFI